MPGMTVACLTGWLMSLCGLLLEQTVAEMVARLFSNVSRAGFAHHKNVCGMEVRL